MELISKYLQYQQFGKSKQPWYEILQWEQSVNVAGKQTVTIAQKPDFNTLFIQVAQISVSADGLGGTITFTDKIKGKALFTIINNTASWSINTFHYLMNGDEFILESNSATCLFALAYCRITKKSITQNEL